MKQGLRYLPTNGPATRTIGIVNIVKCIDVGSDANAWGVKSRMFSYYAGSVYTETKCIQDGALLISDKMKIMEFFRNLSCYI